MWVKVSPPAVKPRTAAPPRRTTVRPATPPPRAAPAPSRPYSPPPSAPPRAPVGEHGGGQGRVNQAQINAQIERDARAYAQRQAQERLRRMATAPMSERTPTTPQRPGFVPGRLSGRGTGTVGRNYVRVAELRGGPGRYQTQFFIDNYSTPQKLSQHGRIEHLQHTLRDAGYDIAIDGQWGPQTRAAYMDYAHELGQAYAADYTNRVASQVTSEQGRYRPGQLSPAETRYQAEVKRLEAARRAPSLEAGGQGRAPLETLLKVPPLYATGDLPNVTPQEALQRAIHRAQIAGPYTRAQVLDYKQRIDSEINFLKQQHPDWNLPLGEWEYRAREELRYRPPGEMQENIAAEIARHLSPTDMITKGVSLGALVHDVGAATAFLNPETVVGVAAGLGVGARVAGTAARDIRALEAARFIPDTITTAARGERFGIGIGAAKGAHWSEAPLTIRGSEGKFALFGAKGQRIGLYDTAQEAVRAGRRIARATARFRPEGPGAITRGARAARTRIEETYYNSQDELAAIRVRQQFIDQARLVPGMTGQDVNHGLFLHDWHAITIAKEEGISLDEAWRKIYSEVRFEPRSPTVAEGLPQVLEGDQFGADVPLEQATGAVQRAVQTLDPSLFKQINVDPEMWASLLARGTKWRYWYENSARWVLNYTGGNVQDADKLSQLLALYSAGRDPVLHNTTFAVRAFNQWKLGREITEGSAAQARDANSIMRGEGWRGLKTNSFYGNMLEEFARYDERLAAKYAEMFPNGGVTVDRHMARILGIGDVAVRPGEYEPAAEIFRNIAAQLGDGWKGKQVQAALWVPFKADQLIAKGKGWSGLTAAEITDPARQQDVLDLAGRH